MNYTPDICHLKQIIAMLCSFQYVKTAIKDELFRELATYGTQNEEKTKRKHNTICVGHPYTQINTNNVTNTWALLQTTGGQSELLILKIW
jgi:hypothetical protein